MDHHRESHGDARREVHRGEVFYADLSPVVGSEQGGVRPVLIVQNDVGNRYSPTVIAAAITSKQDKTRLPTHIGLRAGSGGLARDSVVLLEQIRTLDKRRLRERAGCLSDEELARVDRALGVSIGLFGAQG
ncbi:MAG TPA: type II toxin-antitoxin system PemK/MazF family toxin [Candidatus Ruthenibacterium merdigallinarum]|nr:type II toxin-antitoxin system PemK/MazF family toxin [Candidatus Ruthenibacterium merdigallinarum]